MLPRIAPVNAVPHGGQIDACETVTMRGGAENSARNFVNQKYGTD